MAVTSAVDALTRVRYVGQDFQTHVNESTEFLKTKYPDEYNDWVDSNAGIALIQLIGYTAQGLSFYMNRRTTDIYMNTAQTPSAISKIARMLNYTIEAASSASADIVVTLKNGPYTYPITIRKGFRFSGPNGLIFEYRNNEPIVYSPGETEKTFTVYEGETKENTFVSDGTENQKFSLVGVPEENYLIGASTEVYVQNQLWSERNQIPYAIGDFYEIDYVSEPPTIKFGDGIAGSIPDSGSEIRVIFIVGSGRQGRIGSGLISTSLDALVVRNETVELEVNNPSPSSGGDDYEDLRKVKSLAPEFFQSQDRAISKRDYDAIANTYPGVAKSNAYIVRGIDDDYTINFYLDRIVATVNEGVSGIIDDSQAYLDIIESNASAINEAVDDMETDILAVVNPIITNIKTEYSTMATEVSGVVDQMISDISTYWTGVESDLSDIETATDAAITTQEKEVTLPQSTIISLVQQINDTVSGCGSGVTTQVASLGNEINSEVAGIRTGVRTGAETLDTAVNALTASIRSRIGDIQTEIDDLNSEIDTVITARGTNIDTYLDSIPTTISAFVLDFQNSVSGNVENINDAVSGIDQVYKSHSTDIIESVESDVDDLKTYLGETLSTSCSSNTVEVQVLQVDANNTYVAPTSGLLESLRSHLQERADAVHVVKTIDGSIAIVQVDLEVRIKVADDAIQADVRDRAEQSLVKYDDQPYGLLVLRDYGDSLYKYEIQKAVRDIQLRDTDVEYANIDITYPTSKLDSAGNLIIASNEVIVPRTITVAAIL